MVDKLVLGTVQLGLDYGINNPNGKPSLAEAFSILNNAYDNGIKILDTAEAYGNSQEIIGKFQKAFPQKKFNIITKLAANNTLKDGELINHISKSCLILATNTLYGYMFHNYQSFNENLNLYAEILQAKKQGLIQNIGISLYNNNEILDIIENYKDFDFIQIPFNLLDNQSKRKPFLDKARKSGIQVHIRSVFLQGLFFKNVNQLPEKLSPLAPYLKELDAIMLKNRLSTEELALQYVLKKKYIDYVLIGVENTEQLIENIRICNKTINVPHKSIDAINVAQEELLNPVNWS